MVFITMRTIEEISKIVKISNSIQSNHGRFWFTCENSQFDVKKEYSESEFDAVRERFLDSSKFPVQVFAHWQWKNGDEVFTCSKRLGSQWFSFETESERFTIKKGLLQELAQKVLLEQSGVIADDERADELLEAIYKERGRPEVESETFS